MHCILVATGILIWLYSYNVQAQSSYLGGSQQINDSIKNLLQQVEDKTQLVRKYYFDAYKQYGKGADSTKIKLQELGKADSINLVIVKNIYQKYGWPKESQVGGWAAQGAFLQIQHADSITQRQFLPVIRKIARQGELPKFSYGLLKDRVLVGKRKKQIYGTQGGLKTNPDGSREGVMWPIRGYPNIKKINRRRVKMEFSKLDFNEISYDAKVKPKDLLP